MATSLVAQWRFTATTGIPWNEVYAGVKALLVKRFAVVHSRALQQTLYEMGKAVLEHYPVLTEVRLSAPNKHHFVYDLAPFGLENNNEVFNADDRPYGLIQATVTRDDAPPAGSGMGPAAGLVGLTDAGAGYPGSCHRDRRCRRPRVSRRPYRRRERDHHRGRRGCGARPSGRRNHRRSGVLQRRVWSTPTTTSTSGSPAAMPRTARCSSG